MNLVEKLHSWMMKEPKDKILLEGFNVILLGINGLLLSDLLMPIALGEAAKIPFVVAILGVMLEILLWGVRGLIETLTGKK